MKTRRGVALSAPVDKASAWPKNGTIDTPTTFSLHEHDAVKLGSADRQLVHDPEGSFDVLVAVPRADVRDGDELVIGVLDNGKPHAGLLLQTIAALMGDRLSDSRVVIASKFGDCDGAAAMRPVVPEKLAWPPWRDWR
jgi:hypothetical protein